MKWITVLLLATLGIGTPSAFAEGEETLASRNNEFALELFRAVAKEGTGNVFLSPYSVSSAMVMVYEGAAGDTGKEIARVLHFQTEPQVRHLAWSNSIGRINSGDGNSALSTANALWAERTYKFSPEYLGRIGATYKGVATNLDFLTDPEGARSTINRWVEDRTKDKIKDLLPPGSVVTDTRLVLTNAVYFKGDWQNQFDEYLTQDSDFFPLSGTPRKVRMMRSHDFYLRYAETEGIQALELPYKGKTLSMLIFLPKRGEYAAFEKQLDWSQLQRISASLIPQELELYLPKFRIEAKYSLKPTFLEMGLAQAFNPDTADFSGMTGKRDLFISAVIHQSFVEVNEQGTEAAAATAVTMLAGAGIGYPKQKPIFRADRPFLFMIRENVTGAVLFMGRLGEPQS